MPILTLHLYRPISMLCRASSKMKMIVPVDPTAESVCVLLVEIYPSIEMKCGNGNLKLKSFVLLLLCGFVNSVVCSMWFCEQIILHFFFPLQLLHVHIFTFSFSYVNLIFFSQDVYLIYLFSEKESVPLLLDFYNKNN